MKSTHVILLVAGIALLGGLFFLLKSKSAPEPPQASQPPAQNIAAQSPAPVPELSPQIPEPPKLKIFELVIKNKKLVAGPETIKVTEGDKLLIKITADETEEFHVHAYDASVELEKDTQTELQFTANRSGRFPFELEKSKTDLGVLEVLPKP